MKLYKLTTAKIGFLPKSPTLNWIQTNRPAIIISNVQIAPYSQLDTQSCFNAVQSLNARSTYNNIRRTSVHYSNSLKEAISNWKPTNSCSSIVNHLIVDIIRWVKYYHHRCCACRGTAPCTLYRSYPSPRSLSGHTAHTWAHIDVHIAWTPCTGSRCNAACVIAHLHTKGLQPHDL